MPLDDDPKLVPSHSHTEFGDLRVKLARMQGEIDAIKRFTEVSKAGISIENDVTVIPKEREKLLFSKLKKDDLITRLNKAYTVAFQNGYTSICKIILGEEE